jgi:uncharacterized protein with NRDE domain
MCLILIAFRHHPAYPLVVAANRDEFHARPTAPAAFWSDAPHVAGGRDLEAGGTWLGITRDGRFAAVTNVREPHAATPPRPVSRGGLVSRYLAGSEHVAGFLARLPERAAEYRGFNLLAGDPRNLHYYSNRGGAPAPLGPGIHGLSNHLLNSPWPKVTGGCAALAVTLERADGPEPLLESLLSLLADETVAPDRHLPDTGVGPERERLLSPRFIRGGEYGTRSSTALVVTGSGEVWLRERRFGPAGEARGEELLRFPLRPGYPAAPPAV